MGMGGVVLPPKHAVPLHATQGAGKLLVWQARFPNDIAHQLITYDNPRGSVTNSDLELAATVTQHDIITQHYDVRECTLHNATDNTPR